LLSSLVDSPSSRLLFPSAEAVPLDRLDAAQGPFTFVVLDGTWDEAAKMLARSPALRRMPAVSLTSTSASSSSYVVRTQPNDACRSTVETVAEIVAVTEADAGLRDVLLRPLHAMCNAQINHGAVVHDARNLAEVNSGFHKLRYKKKAQRVSQ
jgi:DTW domain-containing protein YfiP